MLKAIAAGAALICATLAWFLIGVAVSTRNNAITPETVGTVAAMMFSFGLGLIVISPFIGLFNWARGK